MSVLDSERLVEIENHAPSFLTTRPYPWLSVQGLIRDDAFKRLAAELPEFGLFDSEFGRERGYGQQSHDRYALQYRAELDANLPPIWREFLAELNGPVYANFLRRVYGLGASERFVLSMHWHFTPRGASVSPHTDVARKIGSHIFYLNTEEDWNPDWGGQTLVLDDENKLNTNSAPAFGALPVAGSSTILGNQSFIFKRTEHSWHAVNPIDCPPDKMRKVFIVVANRVNLKVLWRRLRGLDPDGFKLRV